MPHLVVPTDDDGNIRVWKALAGARHSHVMARPVFPNHQPNYNLEKGVLIRIRQIKRVTGTLPLEPEF